MRITRHILFTALIASVCALSACQSEISTEAELGEVLQGALENVVDENDNVHNAVLQVQGPEFEWQGAAGLADPEADVAMLPVDQFRSASSAKMMLATLALKLAESGVLDLDAPIADYLADDVITGLHIYEGQDYGESLTMRQLLHHTSGLADNWFDERDDGRFVQMVLVDETDKLWQPVEVVTYVKENLPPLFTPGEGLHYSDVNYIVAGLVIEAAAGQPLHEVYRDQIFEPLGMDNSYMEFREEARPSVPGRGLSNVYYSDINYTDFLSLSADWAGGGLATTAEDMTRFLRAFVDDEIFANPATREEMFDWMPWQEMGDRWDYGLGLMRFRGESSALWGHTGVGQSFMLYWPDGDVTMTGTLNQDEVNWSALLGPVLQAVKQFQE